MKPHYYLCALAALFLLGCTDQKSEKQVNAPDTVHTEPPTSIDEPITPPAPEVDMSIAGSWSDGGLTPAFIITQDSIFDPDDQSSARYEQEGEWTIFYYPDEEVHVKAYKPHPDTLVFESVSTKTKYWRVAEPPL